MRDKGVVFDAGQGKLLSAHGSTMLFTAAHSVSSSVRTQYSASSNCFLWRAAQ